MKSVLFLLLLTGCATSSDKILWDDDGFPSDNGQSYFDGEPAWDANCIYGLGCRGTNREKETPTPYVWSLRKYKYPLE
jgi:hypothetical protein